MTNNRIYGDKINIDSSKTESFFDERAKKVDSMECPFTAVLLGDQNPDNAKKWDIYEKEFILPNLNLNSYSTVLDIGCGMGRWAQTVIPECDYYVGVDFSEEMINLAKRNCVFPGKEYDFKKASFQELIANHSLLNKRKFSTVIMCGVCMYINDDELNDCFDYFSELFDGNCVLYLTETVAREKRLTLSDFPSKALKANYDVIYRTPVEYNKLYEKLQKKGFIIKKQDFLPHYNNEKQSYSETERWYTIMCR